MIIIRAIFPGRSFCATKSNCTPTSEGVADREQRRVALRCLQVCCAAAVAAAICT